MLDEPHGKVINGVNMVIKEFVKKTPISRGVLSLMPDYSFGKSK